MAKVVSSRTVETAKPRDKPYAIAVGESLWILVNPNGSKWWRFRYRFHGIAKMISLGVFPETSLAEAKAARDSAKKLLQQGLDPSIVRKSEKLAAKQAMGFSFASIASEWLDRQSHKSASTLKKDQWLLQFAIDDFGAVPIKDVTPILVLSTCAKQESIGKLETANRIKSKCSQVFRYAVATGRLDRDPTSDLKGALKTPQVRHRSALTDPNQVAQLLRDIDGYRGQTPTVCALKLAPLVFIRPGELRAARWADIDLNNAQWCYTPPKTRNQTQLEHIIPLPAQALSILRELHAITGRSEFVFPQLTDFSKCLSENTLNAALRRMGYTSEEMCGHGFRAIARTILDEVLGFRIELIEQQLAHRVADMHGRAYNRTKHLPERRQMMQTWADYLDKIKLNAA